MLLFLTLTDISYVSNINHISFISVAKVCPSPPKSPSPNTFVKCVDKIKNKEINCDFADNRSIINITCAPYFEANKNVPPVFCSDYKWSMDTVEKCRPSKYFTLRLKTYIKK